MIEKGWAIHGKYGLYTGWWLLKKDAIKDHCTSLGLSWAQCRKRGDRAVKIEIRIYLTVKVK